MSIQLITGPMFSGKSSELQRRIRRFTVRFGSCTRKAVLIVPKRDTRYATNSSVTHDGVTAGADLVLDDNQLLEALNDPLVREARLVGIDEGQFFTHLGPACERLAAFGKQVLVAALSSDFRRRPFKPVAELFGLADDVTRLSAVCHTCGNDAAFTARLLSQPQRTSGLSVVCESPVILVGGAEIYRASCRGCHPHKSPLPIVVSIEGPPGCGKSSLLQLVAKDPRFDGLAKVVLEDVDAWPPGLLEAYYSDMPRLSALFQLEALAIRRTRVLAASGGVPVLIIERSWEADRRCFADFQADTGIMPALDAAVYADVSKVITNDMPPLTGAFYLRATPHTCARRVRSRQRQGERPIDEEYLASILQRHDDWLLRSTSTVLMASGEPERELVVKVADGNSDRNPSSAQDAKMLLDELLELCIMVAGKA